MTSKSQLFVFPRFLVTIATFVLHVEICILHVKICIFLLLIRSNFLRVCPGISWFFFYVSLLLVSICQYCAEDFGGQLQDHWPIRWPTSWRISRPAGRPAGRPTTDDFLKCLHFFASFKCCFYGQSGVSPQKNRPYDFVFLTGFSHYKYAGCCWLDKLHGMCGGAVQCCFDDSMCCMPEWIGDECVG